MSKATRTSETPKKRLSMAKVKNAKHHLRILHKKHNLSLRVLAARLGNAVTFQMLGRFISEKDYIPAGEQARTALDLYADISPYRVMPRWWNRTPEALKKFMHIKANVKEMYDKTKEEQFAYRRAK